MVAEPGEQGGDVSCVPKGDLLLVLLLLALGSTGWKGDSLHLFQAVIENIVSEEIQ